MIKSKKTKRKFYNKWLYKVSLRVEGAFAFRVYDLKTLEQMTIGSSNQELSNRYDKIKQNDIAVIRNLLIFLQSLDPDAWSKRIERSCIDIYTNDKDIFDNLSIQFNDIVIQKFEPLEGTLDQLNSSSTIITKKLPHDKYRYRVYLQPHKLAGDIEGKKKYVEWVKNQSPRITCTPAIEEWFIKTNWNWDRRYVLVEDEQTLLMMKLRNSEVVGKIYNFVVCDK